LEKSIALMSLLTQTLSTYSSTDFNATIGTHLAVRSSRQNPIVLSEGLVVNGITKCSYRAWIKSMSSYKAYDFTSNLLRSTRKSTSCLAFVMIKLSILLSS
jgi:hypothetical protein